MTGSIATRLDGEDPRPAAGLRFALLVLVLAVVGCGAATSDAGTQARAGSVSASEVPVHGPHAPADDVPRVLVLTAMESELAPLRDRADLTGELSINGRTHHLGELGGVPVVLAATGVSMVNAAMAAQAAVDRLPLRAILFCGIAGTPSPEVRIGDVTVAARWAEYQEQVFTDPARDGWRRGWRNDAIEAFEFMHPQQVWTLTETGEADAQELTLWFPVGAELLAAARRVDAAEVELRRCNPDGHCLESQPRILVGGNGVSGPTFVDEAAYRDYVWRVFGAHALDMETAAVGHVARTHGIPYLGVRAISDLAGGTRGRNEVTSWLPVAAANAAVVTEALLSVWRDD